jgi:hypothetical protein
MRNVSVRPDLEAIRERCEAFRKELAVHPAMDDAWSAIESANDVPALLAEVERMRSVVEAARVMRAWERTDVITRATTKQELFRRIEEFGPIRDAFNEAVAAYEAQEA